MLSVHSIPGKVSAARMKSMFRSDAERMEKSTTIETAPDSTIIVSLNGHYMTDPVTREYVAKQVLQKVVSLHPTVLQIQEMLGSTREARCFDGLYTSEMIDDMILPRGSPLGNFTAVLPEKSTSDIVSIRLPKQMFGSYRSMQYVGIDVDGTEVVVAHTHLDVFDATGKTRRIQAAAVIKELEEYPCVILSGDFNCLSKEVHSLHPEIGKWVDSHPPPAKYGVVDMDYETLQLFIDAEYTELSTELPPFSTWSGRRVDHVLTRGTEDLTINLHSLYMHCLDHVGTVLEVS